MIPQIYIGKLVFQEERWGVECQTRSYGTIVVPLIEEHGHFLPPSYVDRYIMVSVIGETTETLRCSIEML